MRFLKKSLKDIDKVQSVEGHLSKGEAEVLIDNAKNTSDRGVIVEIGSFRGRSTVALALGSRANKHDIPVYAIEPHESFIGEYGGVYGSNDREEFFKNILKYKLTSEVRLVNLPSHTVVKYWDKMISFLWIDGDHRYDKVKKDLFSWSKFVLPGGRIALHDSVDEKQGPYKAIQYLLKTDSSYKVIKKERSLTLLEKSVY